MAGTNHQGFRLRVLSAISTKKTRNANVTFLQYFVQKAQEDESGRGVSFVDELSVLDVAERLDLKLIENEVGQLKGGVKQVENALKHYGKPVVEPDCLDNFRIIMPEFVSSANEALKDLNNRITNLKEAILILAKDLGEDAEDENNQINLTFMKTINTFRNDVLKAMKQNEIVNAKRKRRERIKKQEAEKKRKAEERKKKKRDMERIRKKTQILKIEMATKNYISPDGSDLSNIEDQSMSIQDAVKIAFEIPLNAPVPTRAASRSVTSESDNWSKRTKRNFSVANLDLTDLKKRKKLETEALTKAPSPKGAFHTRSSSMMPKSKDGFLSQVDKSLKKGAKKKAERIRRKTRGVSIRDNLLFQKELNTSWHKGSASRPRGSSLQIPGQSDYEPAPLMEDLVTNTPFGLTGLSEQPEDKKTAEISEAGAQVEVAEVQPLTSNDVKESEEATIEIAVQIGGGEVPEE